MTLSAWKWLTCAPLFDPGAKSPTIPTDVDPLGRRYMRTRDIRAELMG